MTMAWAPRYSVSEGLTGVVGQKMGHRHKHQRDQAIVSPSLNIQNSASCGWAQKERENDITIPWRGRSSPACVTSLQCPLAAGRWTAVSNGGCCSDPDSTCDHEAVSACWCFKAVSDHSQARRCLSCICLGLQQSINVLVGLIRKIMHDICVCDGQLMSFAKHLGILCHPPTTAFHVSLSFLNLDLATEVSCHWCQHRHILQTHVIKLYWSFSIASK